MKKFLYDILICPKCKRKFDVQIASKQNDDVVEGYLQCKCGCKYPVIDSIPRILDNASEESLKFESLKEKTKKSFGYQWTSFSEMACSFRDNFLNYVWPLDENFFKNKTGLDVGCGFGRHIYNAAQFGAKMVGLDISDAINSTQKNTKSLDNVFLVQSDVYNAPLSDEKFDFVYSIGVLHHLPDPERGFKKLIPLVKPGGAVFIWVYSSRRKFTIFFLELLRKFTHRLPLRLIKYISFVASLIDYCFFIFPAKLLHSIPFINKLADKIFFERVKVYSKYPFQVIYADWFDRLSPPLRFYYDKPDIERWFKDAGLEDVQVTPTGFYGWRGYGVKKG